MLYVTRCLGGLVQGLAPWRYSCSVGCIAPLNLGDAVEGQVHRAQAGAGLEALDLLHALVVQDERQPAEDDEQSSHEQGRHRIAARFTPSRLRDGVQALTR